MLYMTCMCFCLFYHTQDCFRYGHPSNLLYEGRRFSEVELETAWKQTHHPNPVTRDETRSPLLGLGDGLVMVCVLGLVRC